MSDYPLSRILRILTSIAAWAIALGVGLCMVAARMGGMHWILDLLSHFHVQYLGFGALALVFAALGRARWGALVALLVTLAAGRAVAPLWGAAGPSADPNSPTVRVAAMNVRTSNTKYKWVSNWLIEQRADVLVVQEVDREWAEALDASLPGYRRVPTDTLRSDNFGIAIYVEDSWGAGEPIVHLTDLDLPWLEILIQKGGTSLRVFAVHTIPPLGGGRFHSRNSQLAAAVSAAAGSVEPAIIAGDFNATIWSTAIRGALEGQPLRPACLGFGLRGSWHSRLIWTGGILIDHVLVDERLAVTSHDIGRHVGSDHRGVVVDLSRSH